MDGLISTIRQAFPGKPAFTEKNIPDITGKVCIVTGANAGVGKESARILYSKNATVYVASRSSDKSNAAIEEIKAAFPSSQGKIAFLKLDLADLSTIRASVDDFHSKEAKLHVLINNAGVGYPDKGSVTKQGIELQMGVNCVAPMLFTQLLQPTLIETAKTAPTNSVRVVWLSSSAAEAVTPKTFMSTVEKSLEASPATMYFASKFGNFLQSAELATRLHDKAVISVSLNPGNLDSEFWKNVPGFLRWVLQKTVLNPPVYGAYTSLFAATSTMVTIEDSGRHIAPWGRLWDVSSAMVLATRATSEGGSGVGKEFWDWTEAHLRT